MSVAALRHQIISTYGIGARSSALMVFNQEGIQVPLVLTIYSKCIFFLFPQATNVYGSTIA